VLLTSLRGVDQRARGQEQQPQGCGGCASRSRVRGGEQITAPTQGQNDKVCRACSPATGQHETMPTDLDKGDADVLSNPSVL
jgi:hypothetical protein